MTRIEWTDVTWNPVRGCSRVSEGCKNCYAERIAVRFSHKGAPYEGFADVSRRHSETGRATTGVRGHWTGRVELIPEKLDEPLHWRKPRRVFVNSMSDLFHERLRDHEIARVFGVMAAAQAHTFQVLTKRPERMRSWFEWIEQGFAGAGIGGTRLAPVGPSLDKMRKRGGEWANLPWPLSNVWLGVSCEDQRTADERIPLLLRTPAAVRFVSLEPLLGPVDVGAYLLRSDRPPHAEAIYGLLTTGGQWLDWVIVGGESGSGARPFQLDWARSIRDECGAAKVPFFYKQGGQGHRCVHSGKGGHLECIPADLRVREFPR